MKSLLIITLIFWINQSRAQTDAARQTNFNLNKGVALQGYDPVSYFEGRPVMGRAEFHWEYKGIVYQFASSATLTRFKNSPEKFEPAYGGWCAFAMGDYGEKVKIDPLTYKITDGKLYLFYNFWGNNTLKDWNKNEEKLRSAGDRNWSKILH